MSITSRVFAISAGLAIIAGGVWFGGQFIKNSKNSTNKASTDSAVTNDNSEQPWVEVVHGNLFLLKDDGTNERELTTGDQVSAGQTLKTEAKSRANVYFPDGSVARMDEETTITISEGSYNPDSNKLVVKIKLTAGSLWSKIFGLATPDSAWEVKTANSVATVRGTAFGMSYKKGKSHLAVGEHKVALALLDTKTQKPIEEIKADIDEGKEINIDDATINNLVNDANKNEEENTGNDSASKERRAARFETLKQKLEEKIQDATKSFKDETWLKESKEDDSHWNEKLQNLKDAGLEGVDLREEFRSQIRDEFEAQIRERMIEGEGEIIEKENGDTSKDGENTVPSNDEKNPPAPINKLPLEKPVRETLLDKLTPEKLVIRTKADLSSVSEGDKLVFEAVLITTDGTSHVVTDSAEWKVVGPIGKMSSPGVFVAGLDATAAEFGQGSGAIIASWKAPRTEKVFFDKTILFTVSAKVETPNVTDG